MTLKLKLLYNFIKLKLRKKFNDSCFSKKNKRYRQMINRMEGSIYRKNSIIHSPDHPRFDDIVGFDNIDLETNANLYVEYDENSVNYDAVFF